MRFTTPREPGLDQRAEQFATPSLEKIVEITRRHVPALEASDDDAVWVLAGMHHCVITTVGRRSGNPHKVSVPFWLDRDGHRIVVASFAGAAKHPAWYLNLRDRAANPTVTVRVQGGSFTARPDVLDGSEYAGIWSQLVADRPWYDDYQRRTERQIPLVRLVEIGD